MEKNIKHNIDIVVDRLVVKPGIEKRLTDSLENVFELTEGNAIVDIVDGEQMTFSQNFACPDCGISIDEVEPRSFSFNNPFGACPTCYGLGYKMEFDPQLMVPDSSLSISEGAIQVMAGSHVQTQRAIPMRHFVRCMRAMGFLSTHRLMIYLQI